LAGDLCLAEFIDDELLISARATTKRFVLTHLTCMTHLPVLLTLSPVQDLTSVGENVYSTCKAENVKVTFFDFKKVNAKNVKKT